MTLSKYKTSVLTAIQETEANKLPDYKPQVLQAMTPTFDPSLEQSFDIPKIEPVQEQKPFTAVTPTEQTDFTGGFVSPVKPVEPIQNIAPQAPKQPITDFTPQTADNQFVSGNKELQGGVDTVDEATYLLERLGNWVATVPNIAPQILGTAGSLTTTNLRSNIAKDILDQNRDKLTPEMVKTAEERIASFKKSEADTDKFWSDVIKFEVVKDRTQDIMQKYDGKVDDFTKFAGDVSVGALDMLPQTAIAYFSGGTGAMAYVFANSSAKSTKQALALGADLDTAKIYGLTMGAIETGTEMISGGWAGAPKGMGWASKGVMDVVQDGVLKFAKTDLAKKVVSYGMEYLGEGFEEYLSEVLGNYANAIIGQDVKSFGEVQKDAFYSGLVGTFTAMLSSAGQVATVKVAENVVKNDVATFESMDKPQQMEYAKQVLQKSDTNLIFADNYEGQEVKGAGMFTVSKDGQKTIVLPTRMETDNNNLLTVSLMHEFTHTLEQSGEYDRFHKMVIDNLDKNGILENLRKNKQDLYKNENLTDEEIDQEIVATFVQDNIFKRVGKVDGELTTFTDPLAFRKFLKDMGVKDYNIFRKMVNNFLNAHYKGELREEYDALLKKYDKAKIEDKKAIADDISALVQKMDLTEPAITKSMEFAFNEVANSVKGEVKPTKEPVFYKEDGTQIKPNRYMLDAAEKNSKEVGLPKNELMAIHNITEEKLLKTLELGGFPVPSIAVTKDTMGHENFGDISVVFNPNVLEKSPTFWRDGYTPRFPDTIVGFSDKLNLDLFIKSEINKLELLKSDDVISEERANDIIDALNFYKQGINNFSPYDVETALRQLARRDYVSAIKGMPISSTSEGYVIDYLQQNGAKEYLIKETDRFTPSGNRKSFNQMTQEMTLEAIAKSMIKSDLVGAEGYQDYNFNLLSPLAIDVMYNKKNIKENAKLLGELDEDDFEQITTDIEFSLDKIKSSIVLNKIFKDDYDFEEAFKKYMTLYGSSTSEQTLIAYFKKRFNADLSKTMNLDDVTTSSGQNVNEFVKGVIIPKVISRSDSIYEISRQWLEKDGKTLMVEYANTEQNAIDGVYKTMSFNLEEELNKLSYAKLLSDEIDRMRNVVTPMFEAKPKRVVNFNEIDKVILPDNSNQKLLDKLDQLSIPYETYNSQKTGDRFNVVKAQNKSKFMLEDDTKTRSVPITTANAGVLTEEQQNTLVSDIENGKFEYQVSGDKKALAYADGKVNANPDKAYQDFKSAYENDRVMTKNDIAVAERLIKHFADTKQNSKIEELIGMVADIGTNLGQQVQALSLIKKMSPAGQAMVLQKVLDRIEEGYRGSKLEQTVDYSMPEVKTPQIEAKQAVGDFMKEKDKVTNWEGENVDTVQKSLNRVAKKHKVDNTAVLIDQELVKSLNEQTTDEGKKEVVDKIKKDAKKKLDSVIKTLNKVQKNYEGKKIDLSIDPSLKEELLNAKNQDEIDAVVEKIKVDVASRLPSTLGDKLQAWRFLSMLGNPKTHIRNIISNATFGFTSKIKDKVALAIEQGFIKPEDRTKALSVKKPIKNWANEIFNKRVGEITQSGKYDMTRDIESRKKIFDTKVLESARVKNSNLLENEDVIAMRGAFVDVLGQFMTARGYDPKTITDEQLEKAVNYAIDQAKIRTFRQHSKTASMLNQWEKQNAFTKVVIGSLVPFKKTPINILKTGFEYSPAGLALNIPYGIAKVKSGEWTSTQFIDKISAGLTGSGIALIGALLFSQGILSVGDDDEKSKKETTFGSNLGGQRYSLNLGDWSVSLDWLSPAVMPLMVGAEMAKWWQQDKGANLIDEGAEALANIFNPAFDLTMLQGISDTFKSFESAGSSQIGDILTTVMANYSTQFFPTIGGQIAKTIDPTVRSTYAGSGLSGAIDTTINKIKNKIPFVSMMNEPVINVKGEEVTQIGGAYTDDVVGNVGGVVIRALQNFLNPANIKENIADDTDAEIMKVFNQTGDTSVLPSLAPSSFTYEGEKYTLQGEDKTQYAKTMGKVAYNSLAEVFDSKLYKGLSNEAKSAVIADTLTYASSVAKAEMVGDKYINTTLQKMSEAEDNGVTISEYLIMDTKLNTIQSTEDFTRKEQFIADLVYSGYSDDEIYRYLVYVGDYAYTKADQRYIDILRSVK